MWAAAVIVSALVGVALAWWSVALGFTFFLVPIVFCELLLFGAIHLLRLGRSPEGDLRETEGDWQMDWRYPRLERSRQGQAGRAPERRPA